MSYTPAPQPYYLRLGLELDGELIEERFVEPGEVVYIGHEQRSNLLCWGRLPRRMQLFTYERGQPIVLISPQWLTQHSSPRSISPRSHPSERSIPTALPPGESFTLDLDGALLHITHCPLDTHILTPHVPDFAPEAGSIAPARIALTSLAVCSMLWALATVAWDQAAPSLKARHAPRLATASALPSPPVASSAQPAHVSSPQVGIALPARAVKHESELSWQEREVQRLLQRNSQDYRDCFDANMPATRVIFDLQIDPLSQRSRIGELRVAESSGASPQILSCLSERIHEAPLPHYQERFDIQFHVIFDPEK